MVSFFHRDAQRTTPKGVLDEDVADILDKGRVLVVGAGGIGSELLKNLVLSGFGHIDIVDLDLIDPTNLNRQFLFRKEHVGLPKAEVARQAALQLRKDVDIVAHHANIKDSRFGSDFLQRFDIVLSALDNNDARRYVNRLCISLGVPMIDSGSTGYNGQVTLILKNVTSCFECRPPPRQKGFPVCTIRSTPQKPEHCIAWAKYLFDLLFGPKDDSNLLVDLKDNLTLSDGATAAAGAQCAQKIFSFLFDDEIRRQSTLLNIPKPSGMPRNVESTTIPSPKPLDTAEFFCNSTGLRHSFDVAHLRELSRPTHRQPWTVSECVAKFSESLTTLLQGLHVTNGTCKALFSKDNPTAMDFVAAVANLRMENYGISRISRWDAETIAGSIIPAIASTNAIVAGLQTAQALHFLKARARKAHTSVQSLAENGVKHVWVKQFPLGPYQLLPETLEPPSSTCFVCQTHRVFVALHSLQEWTLELFVKIILKDTLGCKEPVVELASTQLCIYDPDMEEDDEEFPRRMKLPLAAWNIETGASLFVVDMVQGIFECELVLREDPIHVQMHHAAKKSEEHETLSETSTATEFSAAFHVFKSYFVLDSQLPCVTTSSSQSSPVLENNGSSPRVVVSSVPKKPRLMLEEGSTDTHTDWSRRTDSPLAVAQPGKPTQVELPNGKYAKPGAAYTTPTPVAGLTRNRPLEPSAEDIVLSSDDDELIL